MRMGKLKSCQMLSDIKEIAWKQLDNALISRLMFFPLFFKKLNVVDSM